MNGNNIFDIKIILDIIFNSTNRNIKFFADSYLFKDASAISKWKNKKLTPSIYDLSKIVEFVGNEATVLQRKMIRHRLIDLINASSLKEEIKNILLSIDDFNDFLLETLNTSILINGNKGDLWWSKVLKH